MHSGILYKLPTRRYGFYDSGQIIELTSGERIEIKVDGVWKLTRIEYNQSQKDYYSIDGYELDGAYVRVQ